MNPGHAELFLYSTLLRKKSASTFAHLNKHQAVAGLDFGSFYEQEDKNGSKLESGMAEDVFLLFALLANLP